MSRPTTELNPSQQRAVEERGGHLLIVAGPGTGKTHTITFRIESLLKELENHEHILAITFTRKAAEELRARLEKRTGRESARIFAGTFHQFCLDVLRAYDPLHEYKVAAPEDIRQWVKEKWPKRKARALKDFLNAVSLFKATPGAKEAPEEYGTYQDLLKTKGVIDFDDVLCYALELLKKNADILDAVRRKYPFIFVDEYQDINAVQHELLITLIGENNRLTAIGDPNQAIYGFRGSDVRFFKSFAEDFPGARLLTLVDNYRSSEHLLTASSQVIAKDSSFDVPPLTAQIYREGRLSIYEAATEKAEAEYVVHQIEKMIGGTSMFSQDSGRVLSFEDAEISFGDIAILYRINSQSLALQTALERSGIPYHVNTAKKEEEIDDICPNRCDNVSVDAEKVTLMSLHASKGLEFPVVFIVGCEEKLLPLDLNGMTSRPEEERRLFYVGMTRAKQWLYLLRSRRRSFFGKTWETKASPFLADIEEELKAYEVNRLKKKRKKPKDQQMQLF